jgi:hypothetical protein
LAGLGGSTPLAWWLSILTVRPILGLVITEPAAKTISALLLLENFYCCNASDRLKYATLDLLFVNVSVGGALTHFAGPPVLMVASIWGGICCTWHRISDGMRWRVLSAPKHSTTGF